MGNSQEWAHLLVHHRTSRLPPLVFTRPDYYDIIHPSDICIDKKSPIFFFVNLWHYVCGAMGAENAFNTCHFLFLHWIMDAN